MGFLLELPRHFHFSNWRRFLPRGIATALLVFNLARKTRNASHAAAAAAAKRKGDSSGLMFVAQSPLLTRCAFERSEAGFGYRRN